MILDASAVLAILQSEEGAPALVAALEAADVRRMSGAGVVEAAIVLHARYGDHGERELDLFLERARVEVVPVTEDQVELARSGYRRFGRGRHPAGLNYGDGSSYALARALDEELLFVGEDFDRTHVRVAG